MGRRNRHRKIRQFTFTGKISKVTRGQFQAVVEIDKPFRFGGKDYRLVVINGATVGRSTLIRHQHTSIGDRVSGVARRGADSLLAVTVSPEDLDLNRLGLVAEEAKPWWKWPWW